MSEASSGQVPVAVVPAAAAATQDASDGGGVQPAERLAGAALPATGDVVLDASFVIALLQRDTAAMALAHVLPRGVMTAVTAGEVFVAVAGATGTDPQRIEGVLRALGVRIVDLPLAAAHQFPVLLRIGFERCASGEEAIGVRYATLLLGDLCVLGYALVTGAPVLTSNQHWAALVAREVKIQVYHL